MRFTPLLNRKQKLVSQLISRFSQILTRENWSYWESQFLGNGPETMLIVSQNDPLFGMHYAAWMRDKLGNCQLQILKSDTHMVIRTNADEISDLILRFLQSNKSMAMTGS